MGKFCSNSKHKDHHWSVDIIIQGVAGCIGSRRSAAEDLQLRRKAIVLLALLAFEILTNRHLPNGANFLILILQELLSDWDVEATGTPNAPEIMKERTLETREGLILLNRPVASPVNASTCLRLLTNSRDMVESTGRQARGYEVVDLARTFEMRIYTYLCGNSL